MVKPYLSQKPQKFTDVLNINSTKGKGILIPEKFITVDSCNTSPPTPLRRGAFD
jgi:hypothetical protein